MKSHLLHAYLTIQSKGVTPEKIYRTCLNAADHSRATGQPASIVANEGGEFSAYGDTLPGSSSAYPRETYHPILASRYWHPTSPAPEQTSYVLLRLKSGLAKRSWARARKSSEGPA